MKSILVGVILLVGTSSALAQNVVVSLVSPAQAVSPAATIKLDLLAVNPSLTDAVFEAPEALHGLLWFDGRSWPVALEATAPESRTVQPGQFAHRGYTLRLPPEAKGRLVLEISAGRYAPLRTVIVVSEEDVTSVDKPALPVSTLDAASSTLSQVQRNFVGRFSTHDPIYFVYGTKVPGAKFQFSFKYRLLDFQREPASTADRTLQFGYTQRSLWDITGDSSPFYDTSYMPSLFYESLATQAAINRIGPLTWVGFQAGYQHESNGQSLGRSRSLNLLYVRPAVVVGPLSDWHVIVVPRIWTYVGGLSDNRDLKNYRGYGELLAILGRNDGPTLAYTGRAGKDLTHFTTQLDLTIPARSKFLDFATYILVQYFNGYGESLRDYNKKSDALRVGFSLVR
ncbi:MAG: phospholipase A [Opitutaceae bacterium]